MGTLKKDHAPAAKRDALIKKSEESAGARALVPVTPVTPVTPVRQALEATFSIVGIGASAGGLEALELFLKNVPPTSGLAYVVVQHQDPAYKGMLVELLQRNTLIPVVQIKNRMRVRPNYVFVIPPNRELSILHGVLHLLEPAAPRGLRLPIDYFFRSLAADCGARSVGVILSGMGSDGSLGLRAIKESAGAAFVQTPSSAKFDGMPRSAIDAGLADAIAPPEELFGKIIGYANHPALNQGPEQVLVGKDHSALEKIIIFLRAHTGHDFTHYKKSSLYRRIERRMDLHRLPKIADYVRFLQSNPQELDLLFSELLIGVTRFFRDPALWTQLRDQTLPALLKSRTHGGVLRAWVAGCSTGEEAYSLVMCFREALDCLNVAKKAAGAPMHQCALMVFATDLNKDAIERARTGIYPASIAADVTDERLRRFFTQHEQGYRINKEIREQVIFAPHDLISDPPFTKLDIVSCRNVLIYLEAELQKRLIALFHYSLTPGGVLLLGSAETVGAATDLFEPLPGKLRLYHRLESARAHGTVDFPSAYARRHPVTAPTAVSTLSALPSVASLQTRAEHFLLTHYAPAAVLVNAKGDIVYVSGKTGKYLEPAAGQANFNLFAMARDGLRLGLPGALRKALKQNIAITMPSAKVGTNGGSQSVEVSLHPLNAQQGLPEMVMVVFADAAMPVPVPVPTPLKTGRSKTLSSMRIRVLEQQLRDAHAALEQAQQQMQSSQEELQSSNEEMQSTNEELQSTIEELTTSKEEMQSMNEELQTVNHELQAKVEELSNISDDMSNLLNSTEIATLFLDEELNVRRYTAQTTNIIKLRPGDVGRPITDIVSNMDYPSLADDAREVLRSLVFVEKQIPAANERWFLVRIMPYRTQQNRIQGIVVTFSDISIAKRLEAQLRATQEGLEQRIAPPFKEQI